MTSLSIHGEYGRKLTILVKGYERDAAEDAYDANWLRCFAGVELDGFHGGVDASFTTVDFMELLMAMARLISGEGATATFNPMEEALAFCVEVDRAGKATIRGKLRDNIRGVAELSFSFESDLTFLTEAYSDLKDVVASFPHRAPGT